MRRAVLRLSVSVVVAVATAVVLLPGAAVAEPLDPRSPVLATHAGAFTEPPGGEKVAYPGIARSAPAPQPAEHSDGGGAGGGTVAFVAYSGATTIVYSGSNLITSTTTVTLFLTDNFYYRFDVHGAAITPGTGCVQITPSIVDCAAPGAVVINAFLIEGDDTYNQQDIHPVDAANIYGGGGNDQIKTRGIDNQGPSYVQGEGGADTATYDDSSTTLARTFTLSSASVSRSNAGGTMTFSDVSNESVVVRAGTGSDTINVNASIKTITVDPGAGEANFTTVGTGDLDNILAPVTVLSEAADVVALNDSVAAYGDTYTVTGAGVFRPNFGGLLTPTMAGKLTIFGQSSGNFWNVTSTSLETTIAGGPGPDYVTAGTMPAIDAPLKYVGGGHYDILVVDDRANTSPGVMGIGPTVITMAGSGGIEFNHTGIDVEELNVYGSDVANVMSLYGTTAPSVTRIFAGDGDDEVAVGGSLDYISTTFPSSIEGGNGTDKIIAVDSATANPTGATFTITNASVSKLDSGMFYYGTTESLDFLGSPGPDWIQLTSTLADFTTRIDGIGGDDIFVVGPDQSQLLGSTTLVGGAGNDGAAYQDSLAVTGHTYEVRGGERVDRDGVPPLRYSEIEEDAIFASDWDDTVRLLSTSEGGATEIDADSGADVVQYFAANIATTGDGELYGGGGVDELQIFASGLGTILGGPCLLQTPGRHDVFCDEFEASTYLSQSPDGDGDGCDDVFETGSNENFGGLRNPADYYDWFDIAGGAGQPPNAFNQAIDLTDALAVLAVFGLTPVDNGYSPSYDRVTGPALQPWRARPATGDAMGIDLQDALVLLQSFGHLCS